MDDLLDDATDILPGLDLVMIDREFALDGVKDTCEKHDVHYLNPGVVRSSSDHEHQIAKLASEDKDFDVVDQERLDDWPTRKAVYLLKREWEREEEGDDGTDVTVRQEIIEDFEDIGDTTPLSEDRDGDSPLSNLLDEVTEEEEIEEPKRVEPPTMPFETNLPWVDVDPADDREMKHQIGRLMPGTSSAGASRYLFSSGDGSDVLESFFPGWSNPIALAALLGLRVVVNLALTAMSASAAGAKNVLRLLRAV